MKRLLPALAVLLFPLSALAQEPPPPPPATPVPSATPQMIGADLQLAVPVGDFSDGAGLGIGAMLRYERNVMPKLNVTGRAGFVYHLSKDVGGGKVNFSTIPVLVGAKYDLTDAIYAAVELGLFHNAATAKVGNLSVSSSENDFGATLGGGFRTGDIDLRLGLHILDLSDASKSMAIVIGAGYNFWHG